MTPRSLKMPIAEGTLMQLPLVEADPVQFYESLARQPGGLNSPLLATLFRVLARLEQRRRDREAFAHRFGSPRTIDDFIEGVSL